MNLNRMAKEVHQNATEHGWWEGDRDGDEIIALIHSEWSEALEEYRADRPMVWHVCTDNVAEKPIHEDTVCEECPDCLYFETANTCEFRLDKPEGIAVELIDGCIRILDLFAKYGYQSVNGTLAGLEARSRSTFGNLRKETPAPSVIAMLHQMTSSAHQIAQMRGGFTQAALAPLEAAVGMACAWVRLQGCDPEAIMLEKHRYNLTRPYKHGGKKC